MVRVNIIIIMEFPSHFLFEESYQKFERFDQSEEVTDQVQIIV